MSGTRQNQKMLLSSQHTDIPNILNIDPSKTNPLFVLKTHPMVYVTN